VCIQQFKVGRLDKETIKIGPLLSNYYVIYFNDAEHSTVLRSQLITERVRNISYTMTEWKWRTTVESRVKFDRVLNLKRSIKTAWKMILYMTNYKNGDKSKFCGYNQVWHSLHKLWSHTRASQADPYNFTIYASLTTATDALKETRR
jgi:hypothetical protein